MGVKNMAHFVIVYASITGNTEAMAKAIAEGIKQNGYQVDQIIAYDAHASDLNQYDGVLIGTYTWGTGELPDEMLDFYDELQVVDLSGKKAAVFGSYDSLYGDDGIAVDIMIEALTKQGADVIADGYKIELTPNAEQLEACAAFGRWFSDQVTQK